ncbi:MAG TPA: adenylate/guanylate cyclase domain-containing protein, partial [Anaerolineae bacterium]
DFQWDLLCPLCRVAKESVSRLADVNRQVHCNTCNIDYTANFDRSVELTFRPNPSIRQIEEQLEFCTIGPQATPHIAVQQVLAPGGTRVATPELEPGRYRLRTLELPGGHFLRVTAGGQEEITLQARREGWPNDEALLSPSPALTLANSTDEEMLFILERLAWTDQAATAAEVTALQRFRDLFANEALRPGDQIQVGSLAILFTDLCESTRLYREIGDAPAFGLVMDHFDVLRQAIHAEDGAMVKTIGDAVMAVFRRPVSALRAIMAAQQQLASPPPGRRPLHLKAALHYGPSIAVTLNDRLDYFGSTVNIASRLEKFAGGGEIVLSETVYADPEVCDFLAEQEHQYLIESFEQTLRGFDEDCFCLWRVKMNSMAEPV